VIEFEINNSPEKNKTSIQVSIFLKKFQLFTLRLNFNCNKLINNNLIAVQPKQFDKNGLVWLLP